MTAPRCEVVPWLWVDPLRRLRHTVARRTDFPGYIGLVSYVTGCGSYVSVDDVNPRTKVEGSPTCFRCIVAHPHSLMIPSRE